MLLELLIAGSSLSFATYGSWYFFKAKTVQPLTLDDLALTWRIHKQQTHCTASRLQSLITKNNEVVGFKCECGYEFQQKRLITHRARKPRGFSGNLPHQAFNSSAGMWEENL
ncbi:MAG TPA: hypothetical protein VGB11_07050 [Candidatus Bathyarchaeia archaeon]